MGKYVQQKNKASKKIKGGHYYSPWDPRITRTDTSTGDIYIFDICTRESSGGNIWSKTGNVYVSIAPYNNIERGNLYNTKYPLSMDLQLRDTRFLDICKQNKELFYFIQ